MQQEIHRFAPRATQYMFCQFSYHFLKFLIDQDQARLKKILVRYRNLDTWIYLGRLYPPRFYQPRYNLGRFYLRRYYPS